MNKFIYDENQYGLLPDAFEWLTSMGLRETLWILDANWIIYHIKYHKWIKLCCE